ncbi:MAG: hypothetical protein ABIH89_01115 [Elusimicrobiota bacterium]
MKIIKTITLLAIISALSLSLVLAADDDSGFSISELGVPSWVIDAALKFVNNPDDVFYNFHLDNVDYSPVVEDQPATLRTNFLTTFFPFTWGNLNLKVKVMPDEKYYNWMPQIDLMGSYGRIIGLDLASKFMTSDSTDSFKPPTMVDYSVGILLTKAVSQETRLYAGFQYSLISLDFEFPEPLEITDDTSLSKINVMRKDYIVVTGISNTIRKDKRIVAYVGYGFNYKKIFSRFMWYYDHLEMGFNVYPEGLLVIHPFLGWHWNF